MKQGWIKLYRSIEENEFYFAERFSKMHAWIDLLLLANHKPRTIFIRGAEIHLQPGDLAYSQQTLAKRWKWNYRTVVKFLIMLEKREMIHSEKSSVTTVISIQKWNEYQNSAERSAEQNAERVQCRMQTDKNVKNGENVVSSTDDHDFRKFVDELTTVLTKQDIPVNTSRLSLRLEKPFHEYGAEKTKDAFNKAIAQWKRNGHQGDFLSYTLKILREDYERQPNH